jgi:hypothetical protein
MAIVLSCGCTPVLTGAHGLDISLGTQVAPNSLVASLGGLLGLTQLWGSKVSKRRRHMCNIELTDGVVAKAVGKSHLCKFINACCLLRRTLCEHLHAQLTQESERYGGMLLWPCVCCGAWAVALGCMWFVLSCRMLQTELEGQWSHLQGRWGRLSIMW